MKRQIRKTRGRPATSKKTDVALEVFVEASAKVLGLKIKKSWRRSVLANLQVTLQHARRVSDFPFPDDAEPAPIFKA